MRKQKFAISTFFHYKSMGHISCNGNQSSISDLNKKQHFWFPPPVDALCQISKRFGHTASEEMSFEIVDDGRTTADDGYLPIL